MLRPPTAHRMSWCWEASGGAPRSHAGAGCGWSPLQVSRTPATPQAQESRSVREAELPTTYFTCKTAPGQQPSSHTRAPGTPQTACLEHYSPSCFRGRRTSGVAAGLSPLDSGGWAWVGGWSVLRQAGHSDADMLCGHACSGFVNFLRTLEVLL